ncbi:hypothetical protein C4901_16900 [Acidiferrobacter sp. SPIII_3]|nr:hypothetical protein C4901_16900 [Acidiferrobacter sp. SPIII_3]
MREAFIPVNRFVSESAQEFAFADFADAVRHEAGRHTGANPIITRDSQGLVRVVWRGPPPLMPFREY